MAENKTKIDRLHDNLPKHLNTKTNINWKGLLDAIGQVDEDTANLVAEVRKQFFIKTANRPYLDRLAANSKVSRPRLVGMSDSSFREYIPVLSYKPKQVKLIIDSLLDIFFFKESTTAFIMSSLSEPFTLEDGWELLYSVDNQYQEKVVFNDSDFTDISQATADEIVASFNRQAKYSYATNYYDSITKKNFIRIFTKTVGSKGSIEIDGGRANIGLQLNGFIAGAGTGINTQWTISKIGDLVTFENTGGQSPGLNQLQVGDILISNIPGNQGSFKIEEIDILNNLLKIKNLFATAGIYTQTSSNDTKFIRPEKYVAYKTPRRAMTWETSPGEIIVEMPTTPPVVQRSLRGSTHINGEFSLMTNRDSDSSLTVKDATGFPKSGQFIIEPVNNILSKIITPDITETISKNINGRLIFDNQRYSYTTRIALSTTADTVQGSNQIAVASVAGLMNGMSIFVDGLREDAVITSISGLIITSSIPVEKTQTSVSIEFGGNTLTGITPNLPALSSLNEYQLSSLSRSSNVVTATTIIAHNYDIGDTVIIRDSAGILFLNTLGNTIFGSNVITNLSSTLGVATGSLISGAGIPTGSRVLEILSPSSLLIDKNATSTNINSAISFYEDLNGSFTIKSITSNTFTYNLYGTDGSAGTVGYARVEKISLSNTDSKIIITGAQSCLNTRITGNYIWDTSASYVLSSATAQIQDEIKLGTIVRLLNISNNEIPVESGYLIFDYGRENEEGPIRYLYKPSDNTIAIDPSYIFQKNHSINSPIVALRQKGPHAMSSQASEYAPYITDPSEAREILKDLIRSVKSAGIFVNFLIRFPEQLYGVYDTYNQQGNGAGQPFNR
jgi:hypothetical protein